MIDLNKIKVEDIFKSKDNIIIAIIIVVGLVIGLKINAANVGKVRVLEQKLVEEKDMGSFYSDANLLARDFQEYGEKILLEPDSAEVVSLINQWAQQSGVEIVHIRPKFKTQGELFINLPVEVKARADYYSLGNFLSRLENSKNFIILNNLRIDKTGQSLGQMMQMGKLTADITLSVVGLKKLDPSGLLKRSRL